LGKIRNKNNHFRRDGAQKEWQKIAENSGFKNEREMLESLYLDRKYSLSQIGKKLGFTMMNIKYRLEKLNIERRSRGGPNNIRGK